MSSHYLVQYLLLLFLVHANTVNSKVHYITPSPAGPCPQNSSCLTLSQFAASSSDNETNMSLWFMPGNHTLHQDLVLTHMESFSMIKNGPKNEKVYVECMMHSGRFNISETTSISIHGLHFISCGSNNVSSVKLLTITNCSFQYVQERNTVLEIKDVSAATIVSSSFLSNKLHYQQLIFFFYEDETLDYVYFQQSTPSGVVDTTFSNVSIINSKFTHNGADIGGALVAHNSSLYLARNTFSHNTANFGGAMVTSGCTIDMVNNTFTNNTARGSGGVMVTYNDTLTIISTTFTNNSATTYGGVMMTFGDTSVDVSNSNFSSNRADQYGGVMYTKDHSSFNISYSTLNNNSASGGGVMYTGNHSSFIISYSTLTNNSADGGGVMYTGNHSSFIISYSTLTNNSANTFGGVMYILGHASFNISYCTLINNSAGDGYEGGVMYSRDHSWFNIRCSTLTKNSAFNGGVIYTRDHSSFNISYSTLTNNSARFAGGVLCASEHSSFNISYSTFTNNSAGYWGGVMTTDGHSSFNISYSTLTNNSAGECGGVMHMYTWLDSWFNISYSTLTNNSADYGGVMYTKGHSSFNIIYSTLTNNSARWGGGVMYTTSVLLCIFSNSVFVNNTAATQSGGVFYCGNGAIRIDNSNFSLNVVSNQGGGIIYIVSCSVHINNSIFVQNIGLLYTFNGNLTFSSYNIIDNNPRKAGNEITSEEGGAITSFQSTVIINGKFVISNNQASHGGAILATESTIVVYGETTIANNSAISSGGGISLKQSRLEVMGKCQIVNNSAMKGGGIHASSSTIAVYQPGTLLVINNSAELGGGLYLEVNPKLYILKKIIYLSVVISLNTSNNSAKIGGAVYVADDSNSGACSPDIECFIQILALHQNIESKLLIENILFSENKAATKKGPNLFGGLLDRCIPSQFAEVYNKRKSNQQRLYYNGVNYLENISNINLDSISSQPVRVCFCNSEYEPDCSYHPPTVRVLKGQAFNVSLVAVDQVNHTVDANVTALSSTDGGLGEGQQIQSVDSRMTCTNLTFNMFSPHDSETLSLYPEGPCGSVTLSRNRVSIKFIECTCPVGFEPSSNSQSSTRCECFCDSALSPYITECDITISSVIRKGTNAWINYINDTDPYEYIIYPNCPFDYCQPQSENISINFNLPKGADSQCAFKRTGILCGSCQESMSLSLASSRCVPCNNYWPAVSVAILVAAAIAGILLVTALLAINMTVSVGLINGFIFYANIVSVGSSVFFPSSEPSFLSVFVAWLNLDIGIDVCFINGLDAYTKTLLQFAFPVYIIFLVVMVIILSGCSSKFARLLGKKDPVSTLATLILLSYAKLLSITITALSSAVLHYPNGEQETVWLPDGNVSYFKGKHIPLIFVALLIIIIGLPYTILLLLWQWIVRAPRWKVFNWTRNAKLNNFIATYHVPYNSKHRYWTGLLLLVRVFLYITASVTISSNPQTFPLITVFLSGGLILFKAIFGLRVYKKSFVDVVDTVLYFNFLALALFSLYDFKADIKKQTAVAYASTIITFILFIGAIFYQVVLLIKKKEEPKDLINIRHIVPAKQGKAYVPLTIVELPKRDEDGEPPVEGFAECREIEASYNAYPSQ